LVIQDAEKQEESTTLEDQRPHNYQYVPKSVVGLDIQVRAIKKKLVNVRTLGLVGMGGLGKSTLAKKVFNRLGSDFKYTCFIPDTKLINGSAAALKGEIQNNMYFNGKKVENDEAWRRKPLLLVLDDTNGERDEKVLAEMNETLDSQSRIIFTSRNQCSLDGHHVYNVCFLDSESAKQLFHDYAFRDHIGAATEFRILANDIVRKCDGLPLALEITGKFLGTSKNLEVWEQTLHALNTAEDHPDLNERLWAKLRASFDGLDKTLQQMLLDVATSDHFGCACKSGTKLTLSDAKAAWRAAYNCQASVLWKKLVDLSLVYETREKIRTHEQLRSVGKKIASEPKYGRRVRFEAPSLRPDFKELQEKVLDKRTEEEGRP
jgi:hypothetical protein